MCFSAADGNRGTRGCVHGSADAPVGAGLFDREETSHRQECRCYWILPRRKSRLREFNDANLAVAFDFNGWRVEAEKLAAPPNSLGALFGFAGKPILPENRANLFR